MSLEQSIDLARKTNPDYLEILPGTALDVIDLIRPLVQQPLIFGGLITKESQIRACIERGAVAIQQVMIHFGRYQFKYNLN